MILFYPKGFFAFSLTFFLLILNYTANSQSSIWDKHSLSFVQDKTSLADMTNAIPVSFEGNGLYSSPLISLDKFNFRFGLKSYSSLFISPYGFIKLGSPIISNSPIEDTTVIVPLYNGTEWSSCSYKYSGTAPDRKMIIEFEGTFQPTGEPTKFQIWLFERIGRIQFVYQGISEFIGYESFYRYKIFCKENILNKIHLASVTLSTEIDTANVLYGELAANLATIADSAGYIFQPDTVKPASPGPISFSNVKPACLNVKLEDHAVNETLIYLERADDGVHFNVDKEAYEYAPNTQTTLTYDYTKLQPSRKYIFRAFASNGFLNSDSVTSIIETPSPQITGLIKIPGDYPSITALLKVASDCNHFGGETIIELQKNYSQEVETFPIVFNRELQNDQIKSIIIRPAIDANIKWEMKELTEIFWIDSVKHVMFDGRPGGIGTSRNITFSHPGSEARGFLLYYNGADSGAVNYCTIAINNSVKHEPVGLKGINVGYDERFMGKKIVQTNGFTLSNSSFYGEDKVLNGYFILFRAEDSSGTSNIHILNNEFSNFNEEAIRFENGGANSIIRGNRFYQPNQIYSSDGSCINMLGAGNVIISENLFGGSTAEWGKGNYTISSSVYSFIRYQPARANNTIVLEKNKFQNIKAYVDYFKAINIAGGMSTIKDNQFTLIDIFNSTFFNQNVRIVFLQNGNTRIRGNLFTQIDSKSVLSFITAVGVDSVSITNNDFGGSDNIHTNTAVGDLSALYVGANILTVENNIIHGLFSSQGDLTGIQTGGIKKLIISQNKIYNLQAGNKVYGINAGLHGQTISKISNNTVYGLYTLGIGKDGYGRMAGWSFGIVAHDYLDYGTDDPLEQPDPKREMHIFGNKIHSLTPVPNNPPTSVFELYGIVSSSAIVKIWNNSIRLGIDMYGKNVDTNYTSMMAIGYGREIAGNPLTYIEHNSIYMGGYTRYEAAGIGGYYSPSGTDRVYVTNNIIAMDREIMPGVTSSNIFLSTDNYLTVSANNLWYSSTDTAIQSKLKAYQQKCKCDNSSFIGDPLFKNPTGDSSSLDLHLKNGSASNNAGTSSLLNIQDDLDGVKRADYSPVDIGAYAAVPCSNGTITPSIEITYPTKDTLLLCPDDSAKLISNPSGNFQQLQWQKDLKPIENQNTDSLTTSGTGLYRLVGKNACGEFSSRIITVINTNQNIYPAVRISSSDSAICKGKSVTFSAAVIHGGDSPVYQWKLNGTNVGGSSSTYTTSTLTNGDQVTLDVTSSSDCVAEKNTTSNTLIIAVTEVTLPYVTIASPTGNYACQGYSIVFNATTLNIGESPSYQWFLNGEKVGTDSKDYTGVDLKDKDQLYVAASSLTVCKTRYVAYSDTIVFIGKESKWGTAHIAGDSTFKEGGTVTLTVTSENTGVNPLYQWVEVINPDSLYQIPGATFSTLIYTPSKPLIKLFCLVLDTSFEYCVISGMVFSDTLTIKMLERSGRSAGRLFPNPVTNQLTIDSLDLTKQWTTLEIFNANGYQKLMTINIEGRSSIKIPVYMLTKGVYIVVFRNQSGEKKYLKFLKM
jgi:hypothetical protein